MAQVGGLTGGRCRDAGLIEPNLKEKRAAKKRKWSNNGAPAYGGAQLGAFAIWSPVSGTDGGKVSNPSTVEVPTPACPKHFRRD